MVVLLVCMPMPLGPLNAYLGLSPDLLVPLLVCMPMPLGTLIAYLGLQALSFEVCECDSTPSHTLKVCHSTPSHTLKGLEECDFQHT